MDEKCSMLISVIIPVYKVEAYIRQCVDSVLAQTYENLEVILVDDGSPDGCGAICDEYARRDRRVKVIHQRNQGVSAARNAGLDACSGEVIAFVDSDDWIQPDMYERMMGMLLEKDLDIVFCGANRIDRGKVLEELGRYFEDGAVVDAGKVFDLCLLDKILAHCWNRLCRRHCLENVRFPVGVIYEDLIVSHLPFTYAVRPVGFLHAPLYNYRHNQQGITAKANLRESYYVYLGRRELLRYAREYAPEMVDACLERVVDVAIYACNVSLKHPDVDMAEDIRDIRCYFRENLSHILQCSELRVDRKILVVLFLYMKPLYAFLYRVMKKG